MKTVQLTVVIAWLIAGSYLAVAGWLGSKALESTSTPGQRTADKSATGYEFDGLNFATEPDLIAFLQERRSAAWSPWIFALPLEIIPLLAAAAAGVVGGAARLLRKVALNGTTIAGAEFLSAPLFGAVIGLLLYFLSRLVPAVFTVSAGPMRAETLIGLCLFGGLFSDQAYQWIEAQVVKLFPKQASKKKADEKKAGAAS